MDRMDVAFAEGLEVSSQPPPLLFLNSLPSYVKAKVWAVYLHILEMEGEEPLIYIGSATEKYSGMALRITEYRKGNKLPQYMKPALEKGYKITHTTLLAQCKIPPEGIMPQARARDKNYGMNTACPWPRESFEWGGLGGHSPIDESVRGDSALSPEGLAAEAQAAAEKNRKRTADARDAARVAVGKKPGTKHQPVTAGTKKRNADKYRAKQLRDRANRVFYCNICDVSCTHQSRLDEHMRGGPHLKMVQGLNGKDRNQAQHRLRDAQNHERDAQRDRARAQHKH
ncbi:hypothetical protein B0A48_06329 [Cryoendolithus antarcticus]|uniref:C2H2-type domain-containing protein n=1 Tax=Cryoendolithus antarcticus TaxID=1507870 RepID=A0A1V8TAS3_9PEZI|nr:hypothetical protein B0A48_06329 [Cryoendolithus antarcticus]